MKIFDRFSFMVAFMVFIVFWNMIFGSKATEHLLLLILLGMVLFNTEKISNLFKDSVNSGTKNTQTFEEGIMRTPQVGGDAGGKALV